MGTDCLVPTGKDPGGVDRKRAGTGCPVPAGRGPGGVEGRSGNWLLGTYQHGPGGIDREGAGTGCLVPTGRRRGEQNQWVVCETLASFHLR